MSNITQYRPHNFEVAKQNINALADSRSRDVELSSFETEGWFFGLNDHKVTGGELNSQLVRPLQKKLTGVTNDIKNLFNVCKQVYTAFESLDKDYIGGIVQGLDKANVASVQALNASQQALNASRENQKTQEGLKRTVLALQQTAEEFKNFRRLADSNINQLRDAINRAENSLNNSLNDFKREVSGYIYRLQSDVTDHARRLDESKSAEETLRRDLATASDTLKSQGGQICDLQQTAVSLQSDVTDHARRLDESKSAEETLRRNLTTASDTLKSQGGQICDLQQTAVSLQSDVTDHARRLDESKSAEETLRRDLTSASDTLKSQGGQICDLQQTAASLQSDVTDHARRLDESKSAEETLRCDLTTASDTLKSQGGQIEALQQTATAITEHNGKTDAEIASLKRISPRNAYIIAGAALAISIVHLVLNACGVL